MKNDKKIKAVFLALLLTVSMLSAKEESCEKKGFKLYGKVQFVDSFPDLTIEYVNAFPDIDVEFVTSFPDSCGKWEVVDSFPDFTIKIVTSFPDLKVKKVTSFSGMK